MALQNCHECGKQVSSEAKTCPSCGVKVKPPKKPTSKLLVYILGASVVGSIAVGAFGPKGSGGEVQPPMSAASAAAAADKAAKSKAAYDNMRSAEITCQMEAEKRANDPSSIEWIRDEKEFTFSNATATKATSVQALRAKNAMGALIRTVVRCDLVKTGNNWDVVKMAQK